jgi:glucose-1-phosphate cytidylyltransferase
MKVAILAGGFGSRLQEETSTKPKPMVEIGGYPILWHIMNIYSSYGFNEFVIALGYKGNVIKDYFLNYKYQASNLTIHLQTGEVIIRDGKGDNWIVHLLDTGLNTETGGRVKQVARFIKDETFMLTYGDGLADVDINKLLTFHRRHGRLATVTAVRPPARYGAIAFDGNMVTHFEKKPQVDEGWIDGGFFVLEPGVADYVDDDSTIWEQTPMQRLVADGQLAAYQHEGFWQCMDTQRDKRQLEDLWKNGKAKWKVW